MFELFGLTLHQLADVSTSSAIDDDVTVVSVVSVVVVFGQCRTKDEVCMTLHDALVLRLELASEKETKN